MTREGFRFRHAQRRRKHSSTYTIYIYIHIYLHRWFDLEDSSILSINLVSRRSDGLATRQQFSEESKGLEEKRNLICYKCCPSFSFLLLHVPIEHCILLPRFIHNNMCIEFCTVLETEKNYDLYLNYLQQKYYLLCLHARIFSSRTFFGFLLLRYSVFSRKYRPSNSLHHHSPNHIVQ